MLREQLFQEPITLPVGKLRKVTSEQFDKQQSRGFRQGGKP